MRHPPKLVVFGDPQKGPVADAIEQFTQFIAGRAAIIGSYSVESRGNVCTETGGGKPITSYPGIDECDYAVVFGGDGSIISTARNLSAARVPVIGVNMGKLGFLAEFSVEELREAFDDILGGRVTIEKRMMLGCEVRRGGRQRFCATAVNDVFITSGPPYRMIELQIAVDDQPLAGCVSDGLIISTPTGSTAYNLSAGGPIMAPRLEAMVITPICPHSLSFRPIVVSAASKVAVVGLEVNEGTTLSIDGQVSLRVTTEDSVAVMRENSNFFVVNNPIRSQWDTLATKLGWAGKPKYKG